ncbi:MAG TPA: PAS domain-containing protein [Bacteroidales bacterium]|nr:PAS domain-containing protein [Bacteroidales bacterium]
MKNSIDKIHQSFLSKWQEIVDLLAKIINIPSALIMKIENDYMEVLISSRTENNPYSIGDKEHWYGLYCETVIKTQNKLKVVNALKDQNWNKNPDLKLGMVSYLGFPINFPNGEPFGTICVLDQKENAYSDEYDQLLMQFKKIVELDLAIIESFNITHDISDNEIVNQLLFQNGKIIDSEEKFRTLAEIASDSILLFEGETLVFASRRFCEYIGIEPENIDKLTTREIISRIHPDDIAHYGKVMQESIAEQKKQYTIKFRMLNPSGKYEWLQNNTTATYDSSGKVLGRIVQVRDITKQVELEEKLRKLNADKDQFIRILGHDLRTPFNSLIGLSSFLLDNLYEFDLQEIEEQVRIMNQTSQKTYELLEQILLWVKSQSGKLTIDLQRFDFMNESLKVVQSIENIALKKEIEIKIIETEKMELAADLNIFKTILRNLISNAIKFTNPNGHIVIRAEKQKQHFWISVLDNGMGMEERYGQNQFATKVQHSPLASLIGFRQT